MKFSVFKFAVVTGLVSTLCSFSPVNAQEDEKKSKSRFWVEVQSDEQSSDKSEDGEKKAAITYEVRQQDAPKYWIGIMLKSIEGDLASHLNSDEGVFIESVADDSPAAKAGVKKGDIVVKVGDEKIVNLETMMATMREIGKKEKPAPLKLFIVRNGKEVSVKVVPEKRPARLANVNVNEDIEIQLLDDIKLEGLIGDGENKVFMGKLLEEVVKGGAEGEAVKILRLGSPKVLKGVVNSDKGLEGNISIVVTRTEDEGDADEGEEGQKIVVKVEKQAEDKQMNVTVEKDGEVKEMKVEKLSELPEEVRDIVVSVMPQTAGRNNLRVLNLIGERAAEQKEKALLMARERIEAARAEAEKAQAVAKERAMAAAKVIKQTSASEVDELKKMIEVLRKEILALKKELSDR